MNSLVNSMCADRGGGLNEMKNLLDRHTQTSVGQPNRMPFSSFNFPVCVKGVLKPRAGRLVSCISAFLYRCASQHGVLEREGNGWSPPNINNQCGSETRQAGAILVPNTRIDNTRGTLF